MTDATLITVAFGIVGIVGILIGVAATRYYSAQPGRLEWEVLVDEWMPHFRPLTVKGDDFGGSVPRFVVLRTTNVGKTEIASDDFDPGVAFTIAGKRIVAAEVGWEGLRAKLDVNKNLVGFEPLLMKPNEFVDLRVWAEYDVVSGRPYLVRGRVKGVKEITQRSPG